MGPPFKCAKKFITNFCMTYTKRANITADTKTNWPRHPYSRGSSCVKREGEGVGGKGVGGCCMSDIQLDKHGNRQEKGTLNFWDIMVACQTCRRVRCRKRKWLKKDTVGAAEGWEGIEFEKFRYRYHELNESSRTWCVLWDGRSRPPDAWNFCFFLCFFFMLKCIPAKAYSCNSVNTQKLNIWIPGASWDTDVFFSN